jgi:hypothetical protein
MAPEVGMPQREKATRIRSSKDFMESAAEFASSKAMAGAPYNESRVADVVFDRPRQAFRL